MKSFLQGKGVASVSALKPLAGPRPAVPPCPATPAPEPGGASVEAIHEGGKVVRLVVHCSCGERIEVECLY